MTELRMPRYIGRDLTGRIIAVHCKVCGDMIASQAARGFVYHKNYAEMKMRFPGPSWHVTQLCIRCLPLVRNDETALLALHDADIDDMMLDLLEAFNWKLRDHPKVVAVDTKRKGIP